MADEIKVPVVPEVPKTTADEPFIVNPRAAIESQVITENETIPEPIPDEVEVKPEIKKEEVKSDEVIDDPVERIKKLTQKRINQVIAQKKTTEEQLADAQAEIARLKANPKTEVIADKKDDAPPTVEQVEAYIIKCREDGNVKDEIAAQRYLITLVKDQAIKEVEDRQSKVKSEAESKAQRENTALLDLAKDYIVLNDKGEADMSSDLTLANQKGLLFRTAMSLFNDPELQRDYYNDPDRPTALRRAVADAYREIHQQGILKTPKEKSEIVNRTPRIALADPDATQIEDTPQSTSTLLSDADKVRDEIKARNQRRSPRRVS